MKETLLFLVQGSEPEPYSVEFTKSGEYTGRTITATCTCAAAENGMICKHRLNILGGKADNIVSENADDVTKLLAWLPGTRLAAALAKLRAAEQDEARAKKIHRDVKSQLGRWMLEGKYDHDSEVLLLRDGH